jgi:hypothetical protein
MYCAEKEAALEKQGQQQNSAMRIFTSSRLQAGAYFVQK